MFREKLHKDPNKRGYLYIRDSFYKRDKRTLKKTPKKLSDGTASKKRGKYSKKKDIYCGRIYEVELKRIESFRDYLENNNKDYLKQINKLDFNHLIDEFVKYLLYIYDVNIDEFYSSKKKVYTFADGYCSQDTIKWLKRFNLSSDFYSKSQMKRFYNRCQDCSIFDEDVIQILYLKLIPDIHNKEDIKEEIQNLKTKRLQKKTFHDLMSFMKQ
ncbi:MAG: hypothetical protein ACOC16_01885 [Nanoarchaeota archaeon]